MDRNLVSPAKILPVNSKKTEPSLDFPCRFKQSKQFKKDKSKQVTKKNQPNTLQVRTLRSRSEFPKNTHKSFHKVPIISVPCGLLINVSCADMQKERLSVGDKTLFHLGQ